jgi:hypothetical protein
MLTDAHFDASCCWLLPPKRTPDYFTTFDWDAYGARMECYHKIFLAHINCIMAAQDHTAATQDALMA